MHLVKCTILRRAAIALLTLFLPALPLLGAEPARAAATFIVTTVGDNPDVTPNDGVCDTTAGPGAPCSLRAAIQQANAAPGKDAIRFNIPGPGVKTIRPGAALPDITQAVTIDGYTQPGSSPNTLAKGTNAVLRVELDGSNAGQQTDGLTVAASGSNTVIRGLVINRFDNGIAVEDATNVSVLGCFIGTDPNGTAARANIGDGVDTSGANTSVGGAGLGARNLLSGNGVNGVDLNSSAQGSRVLNNLIGTTKTGIGPLGNVSDGVETTANDTTIGSDLANGSNVIAFNGRDGVTVENPGTRNRVLRNAIFANADLGIDLLNNGPTANDPGDSDAGPNNLQNTPVITIARRILTSGSQVSGTLNSTPNATFVVRFYVNPDKSDEGKVFLGQQSATTNGSGNATFTLFPTRLLNPGETVTATATSASGDTSEFSPPRTVV